MRPAPCQSQFNRPTPQLDSEWGRAASVGGLFRFPMLKQRSRRLRPSNFSFWRRDRKIKLRSIAKSGAGLFRPLGACFENVTGLIRTNARCGVLSDITGNGSMPGLGD